LSIETSRQLAEVAVQKSLGAPAAETFAPSLASAITEAKTAYTSTCPGILDELELRFGPLREQWEARGPGVLAGVQRQLEPDLLVESADVLLVQPVLGGGGRSHLPYNSVRIEAVLANPHAELPEVVRLAWLVAALNLDLPKFSESVPSIRAPGVIALALVPATLAAAEEVELVRDSQALLPRTLEVWNLDATKAEAVGNWWQTYRTSRPKLNVALAALDKLVESGPR
jgi:hypothetical protein